jgi:hypothetical protein
MSTRAAIGFRVGEEVHTIYSHYDGYPKHVGKILQEYYASAEKAKELVYGPQIRNFDHDGTCVRFGDGTLDDHEVNDSPIDSIYGYDYLYLFDFTNPRGDSLPLKGGEGRQNGKNDCANPVARHVTT